MADWSLSITADGRLDLTLGPSPRKTVPLDVDSGRMLADAILRAADVAEGLANAAESHHIAYSYKKEGA